MSHQTPDRPPAIIHPDGKTSMPTIYDLKPRFQALLRPTVVRLADRGVTANQVTLAALGLSVATGLIVALTARWYTPLLLVPVVLFIRMALNAMDGMLAREHAMQTPLGAVLNELGDVLADAALYLPFALIPGVWAAPVVIVVILAVVSEMAGVVAVQIGAARRYDGPLGKSDRAFLFGLAGLLLGLGLQIHGLVNAALIGALILLGLTIKNRARGALQEVA
jgi:CDP-diacylglycerol--glycerol-3-phosphate 3-phosphatidyltransferase